MKVSFDFDSTLSRKDVQEFAKHLVNEGHEVWIVTSRFDTETIIAKNWHWCKDQNQKVFEVAEYCGINPEHIKFTCMESKSIFLKDKGFVFHVDDDSIELMDILESGDKCKPLNVENRDWLENCKELIE